MAIERTSEELSEMEGSLEDLKKVAAEGYEGHQKGGADVRFITKEEQQKRKEAEVQDVDKAFAEYIQSHAELVADRKKLMDIWLGDVQTSTYPPRYLQNSVARGVTQYPGRAAAFYEKTAENQFLACYIDTQGNLYRITLNLGEIPGANEAVTLAGHPISFLEDQFRKIGCDHTRIGKGSWFTGSPDVGLDKMFNDLKAVK